MNKSISEAIKTALKDFSRSSPSANMIYRQGHSLYFNGQAIQLSAAENKFEFIVYDKHDDYRVTIKHARQPEATCTCLTQGYCRHRVAAFLQLHEMISWGEENIPGEGIKYTRNGMIRRVVEERKMKAAKAKYEIRYADNIFGEHLLTNEKNVTYSITFRNLEKKHGYCNCPDYRTNKLGTCKHLIFAFENLQSSFTLPIAEIPKYPFIEIFLNPFREYQISWFYPEEVTGEIAEVLYRYFGNKKYIEDQEIENLIPFFDHIQKYKRVVVRPEVFDKVARLSELQAIKRLQNTTKPDFACLKAPLLPYQQEGVMFATYRKGAIIADEMGLGKTQQAIASAVMKKQLFGFDSAMIVCQATMKESWKNAVALYTGETATLIEGSADVRRQKYLSREHFFRIASFETILRDREIFDDLFFDLLIIDEAQRINTYTSSVFAAINAIRRKHIIVLTGVPFENDLIELYSLVLLADPYLLSPLWEFSYMHCYFASETDNTITGYYGLDDLKTKLSSLLIRRQKQEVIKQLPNVGIVDVPVKLSSVQKKYYLKFFREALDILQKAIISRFDIQHLSLLMVKMRMLADSSFLIDDTTNFSPKLEELRHILVSKLDLRKSNHKIVIFTEWKKMANIIARLLRINKIAFEDATDEDLEKSKAAIERFENAQDTRVLVVTDDAGQYVNHHKATTIINFEVPWQSRQRDNRLGRIDKLGLKEGSLTIINLIAGKTFEEIVAQNTQLENDRLFQVLNPGENDFYAKPENDQIKNLMERLNAMMAELLLEDDRDEQDMKSPGGQMTLDFATDVIEYQEFDNSTDGKTTVEIDSDKEEVETDKNQMNEVLNSGMQFLSQLIKIASGDQKAIQPGSFHFDEKSGEIILKFKTEKKN